MSEAKRRPRGLAILLGLALLSGACMPVPPLDDNGDPSFVRQLVPKLLGRKVKGEAEARLLSQIAGLFGREAVVWTLMAQPDFTEHWIDVLVDGVRMQREGPRMQDPACFGAPLRVIRPIWLANYVRNQPPSAVAPGGPFNMIDLAFAAVSVDNLSSVYRAYPIPLTARPPRAGRTGS
jgi:hypothetical protein